VFGALESTVESRRPADTRLPDSISRQVTEKKPVTAAAKSPTAPNRAGINPGHKPSDPGVAACGGLVRATARWALLQPSAQRRRALLGPTQRIGRGPPVEAVGDAQLRPVWPAQFRRFQRVSSASSKSEGWVLPRRGPQRRLATAAREAAQPPPSFTVGAAWAKKFEVALEGKHGTETLPSYPNLGGGFG